jgi:hypothetical protein
VELRISTLKIGRMERYTENRSRMVQPNYQTIKALFWAYINSLSEVKKRKVLEFVTASGPPAAGFKSLVGGKFVIVFGDGFDTSGMPWAQTCFNRLYLPSYKTSDELVFQFNRALEYSSVGFGFD